MDYFDMSYEDRKKYELRQKEERRFQQSVSDMNADASGRCNCLDCRQRRSCERQKIL